MSIRRDLMTFLVGSRWWLCLVRCWNMVGWDISHERQSALYTSYTHFSREILEEPFRRG